MKLRRLTALFLSAATAVTAISVPTGTVYAEVGTWNETETGVWTYTHTAGDIPVLNIDIENITEENWKSYEYVSAEVTVSNGTAAAALGGHPIGEEWNNSDCKPITDKTDTIYFDTNNRVFDCLEVNFDNEDVTSADTVITISKIKFSTEERVKIGEWYELSEGTWCYRNGDTNIKEIQGLDLMQFVPDDINWANVKYISANIETTGTAQPVIDINFTGNDEEWTSGSPKTVTNDKTTVYYDTNGNEPVWSNLSFWCYDENEIALTANQLLTVSSITFSTEERDYSNVIGEWYQQNGSWYYRNGDSIAYGSIPSLSLENSVTDWSAINYISADVKVDGKANPVIGAEKDGSWANGTEVLTENSTSTIYMYTNGAEIADPCIEFWWCSDDEDVLSANALITVSGITFSTEERDYSNVIGEWYSPTEGTWCYRNGAENVNEIPCLDIDVTGVDWANTTYVSADVSVDNEARTVLGGDNNGEWLEGSPVYINNGASTAFLYTEGKEFSKMNINFWSIPEKEYAVPANALITVTNITFSEEYMSEAEYRNVKGQWVKTNSGYYYNHGDRSDIAYVEGLVLDCPYNIADVQSISITARVAMTGGTPKSVKLTVAGRGITNSGEEYQHPGYNFPFGAAEETVVRKYRGAIVERPSLDISFGKEDLAVIANGGTVEIYVSDISYSIDPIEITYSTPNDLLIDDNETDITGDNEHDIMYQDISKIETTGTLKIYTQSLGSTQNINVFWREWSDFSNITKLETQPVAVGDGVYEIRVTEEALKIIHEKAPYKCELALTGSGYTFVMATFTPDTDAPEPKCEEIKRDELPDKDKLALEQSKSNTIDETKAPESADEFEYGKAHGHKSGRKKHKNGHYMYALRIVERVSKDKLKHAESVTITVYSKKADQYITLTAETCFSHLNINGFKVKAGGNDAFLTVVLDNIPEDDEITFTGFTINYKK